MNRSSNNEPPKSPARPGARPTAAPSKSPARPTKSPTATKSQVPPTPAPPVQVIETFPEGFGESGNDNYYPRMNTFGSDVSSITQSSADTAPSVKSKPTAALKKAESSKAIKPVEKSNTLPNRSPARPTAPTTKRTPALPTPAVSPRDRALAKVQAEEQQRQQAIDAENARIESERQEAFRLEEERLHEEFLATERIEKAKAEVERLEVEEATRQVARLEVAQAQADSESKKSEITRSNSVTRTSSIVRSNSIARTTSVDSDKKAALKAKSDALKAEQDVMRIKQETERKAAAEKAKQAELEKKAALEASRQKIRSKTPGKDDESLTSAQRSVSPRAAVKKADDSSVAQKSVTTGIPDIRSKSAARSRPIMTDEEKRAAARARVEAERAEKLEKERIAAEKKAAQEAARVEAKRIAAEEAAKKEEDRKRVIMNAALIEQERKAAILAGKSKTDTRDKSPRRGDSVSKSKSMTSDASVSSKAPTSLPVQVDETQIQAELNKIAEENNATQAQLAERAALIEFNGKARMAALDEKKQRLLEDYEEEISRAKADKDRAVQEEFELKHLLETQRAKSPPKKGLSSALGIKLSESPKDNPEILALTKSLNEATLRRQAAEKAVQELEDKKTEDEETTMYEKMNEEARVMTDLNRIQAERDLANSIRSQREAELLALKDKKQSVDTSLPITRQESITSFTTKQTTTSSHARSTSPRARSTAKSRAMEKPTAERTDPHIEYVQQTLGPRSVSPKPAVPPVRSASPRAQVRKELTPVQPPPPPENKRAPSPRLTVKPEPAPRAKSPSVATNVPSGMTDIYDVTASLNIDYHHPTAQPIQRKDSPRKQESVAEEKSSIQPTPKKVPEVPIKQVTPKAAPPKNDLIFDRKALIVDAEMQRAIDEAKKKENEDAEARSKREDELRKNTLKLLYLLGQQSSLIDELARRIDDLIQIVFNFKCNKESGEEFGQRLGRLALLLTSVFKSNPLQTESDYKPVVDEMCEVLIDAKKFLIRLASDGYLMIILREDPKSRLIDFDTKLVELYESLLSIFNLSGNKKYEFENSEYDKFVIIDEPTLFTAKSDTTSMRALSLLTGASMSEITYEIALATKKLNELIEDVSDAGAQRQLRHPAMRAFWRLYLSSSYKIGNRVLVEKAIKYIHTEVNPSISDEDLRGISIKMQHALDIIDDTNNHTITVFDINQSTKHIDNSHDFIDVVKALCSQQTLKVFPPLSDAFKESIIWGDDVREFVEESMKAAGKWTIVHGPHLSGKTSRWLVAAHHLEGKDAVVWIDFKNVKSASDMLSTIATQLSLSVLSLDDVMLEFQRLLDSSLEHLSSHCCIVLDHFDFALLEYIGPFMKILKKLQAVLKIAIVVITTNISRPTNSQLLALHKSGKIVIPEEKVTIFEVTSLSKEDAVALASNLDVYDPTLLAFAGRKLPGEIIRLQGIKTPHLRTITTNDRNSLPGSSINRIIAESLSEKETLCATCLFYPLSCPPNQGDGVIFRKSLAWELCRHAMEENVDIFNYSMERLVQYGWLRQTEDSFYISASSIIPNLPTWTFVSESEQWEKYYRYWVNEAVLVNDLLGSKDQLLGCAIFDSSRKHFETLFNDFGVKPVLHGRLRPPVVKEFTCKVSSNIANILEYRFNPMDGLVISKAMLRILCNGDETGVLSDENHWEKEKSLKQIIIRASVNLGWYLYRTKQLQAAEKVLLSALSHLDDNEGLNYAYALNKMAIVLRGIGRKEDSLAMHRKCLALRIKYLGENHVDTAQSLNNIAIVLNGTNQKEEAIKTHERCLKIRLELLGDRHASTGDTYYNMATVMKDIGRKSEMLSCYESAKRAYTATYGEAHSYVKDVSKKIKELNDELTQN